MHNDLVLVFLLGLVWLPQRTITAQAAMLRVTYSEPGKDETPEAIAWHNMREADPHHKLDVFMSGARGWLKANPGKTYQHLEKELRDRKLQTHLIAVKPKAKRVGMHLDWPWPCPVQEDKATAKADKADTKQPTPAPASPEYECIFSCRPTSDAVKEVLQHWPTYDANFKALANAGSYVMEDDTDVKPDLMDIELLTPARRQGLDAVMTNEVKCSITAVEAKKWLQTLQKASNGKAQPLLVGMMADGGPLFALVVNGTTMADSHYTVGSDGVVRLVQVWLP